ncbi:hypothetical protein Sjap_011340 [Stephania japonica]|uniref:Uncharacterized protein n=1 Tax=Stephania japonica TaxID=461633 RepID=A0AAP0P4Y8_9MAGN
MTETAGHMRYQHHNNITLRTREAEIRIRGTGDRVSVLRIDSLEERTDVSVIGAVREVTSVWIVIEPLQLQRVHGSMREFMLWHSLSEKRSDSMSRTMDVRCGTTQCAGQAGEDYEQ